MTAIEILRSGDCSEGEREKRIGSIECILLLKYMFGTRNCPWRITEYCTNQVSSPQCVTCDKPGEFASSPKLAVTCDKGDFQPQIE